MCKYIFLITVLHSIFQNCVNILQLCCLLASPTYRLVYPVKTKTVKRKFRKSFRAIWLMLTISPQPSDADRTAERERERERIRCISNKKWSRNNSSINELDTSSSSKAKANKKGKKKEKQERCVGDHRRTTTATPRSRRSHSIGRSPSIRPPWGLVWYSLVVVVVVAVVNDSFFCLDFFCCFWLLWSLWGSGSGRCRGGEMDLESVNPELAEIDGQIGDILRALQ